MKCYICPTRMPFTDHVIIETNTDRDDVILCPKCATKFVEALANWHDIEVMEQLNYFKELKNGH